ncbi:ubiquitin carboxyl-terminal hydrolase 14-like [Watersipora subatra]|uniref:ubiquitin carboxyl-terminal hydrolase 14-like n=1 Tax=Watersipora subatra TaxID=2589382 RepID=UPI00355B428E
MATYTVNVKWNKEKFEGLELDTSEPTEVFKAQLMALTGVEPDRQKVILRGSTLKHTWDGFKGLKNGVTIQMMGSATALPQAPAEKTVFVEDMTEQQLATHLKAPAGLTNLGNTCYMNATVQCLRSIPELCETLATHSAVGGAAAMDTSSSITDGFQMLVKDLQDSSDAITPLIFLQKIFDAFPRFAERAEQGGFIQQDANEFWIELVRCLQLSLIRPGKSKSFIDEFMRIDYEKKLKCIESDDEPVSSSVEERYQLSCFIDSNVKHMMTGLKSGLKEHITKKSMILDRDAQFEASSLISRLPAYLPIQFIRFQYKSKEGVNAKILKDVKFTFTLDLFEMCTPELQQRLVPMREAMKVEDDKRENEVKQAQLKGEPLKKSRKCVKLPYSFSGDDGSNNSGFYELQAVLTHKGRASSSGHYVAWVKRSEMEWIKFDDDNVTGITIDNIKELSGGGDWHTAYILLYGPKILQREETPAEPSSATQEPMATE